MAISVIAMVFTVAIGGIGSLMALSGLAFLDHCPPPTCSPQGAVNAVTTTILAVALVGLVGLILTIIRLAGRKPAWPFALGTLTAVVAVFVLGAIGYGAAVS